MKSSEETFVVPGQSAPETWRAGGREGATRQDTSKTKNADWIALPMRSIVSVPMRFSAMGPERRQSAAMLELEGLGLAGGETDFQVETRDQDQREQRAWTVVQTTQLPAQAVTAQMDAKFAPSVAFRTLKRGEIQMWSEAGHLALAIPDETGKTLHAQAMTSLEPDEDAAAELRCILASLDLGGMLPEVNEIVIQQPADAVVPADSFANFAAATGMPVSTEPEPAPHLPREPWHLQPPAIVQRRIQRKNQQTMVMAGAGFVLVVLALLGAFAGRLWTRERALMAETRRLDAIAPELAIIQEAKERWQFLETAIMPEKFAMEQYHQVARLLPDKDMRIEDFSIRDGHIVIQGTATNPALTNQLREDLAREAAFAGLVWDFPPPTANPDGTSRFRADGGPPAAEGAPQL